MSSITARLPWSFLWFREQRGSLPLNVSCRPTTMGYVAFPFWLILVVFVTGYSSSLELGVTSVYKYETEVVAGDGWPSPKNAIKSIGYRISADVHVTAVWEDPQQKEEKLIKIQFDNLEFRRSSKDSSVVSRPSNVPLFLEKVGFDLKKTYSSSEIEPYLKNLLKGVASILHYREDTIRVAEKDVSGICDTSYVKVDKRIEKVKVHCSRMDDAVTRGSSIRSASVNFLSRTIYDLDQDDDFQEAVVDERFEIASNLWKNGKANLRSRTTLQKKADEKSKTPILSMQNLDGVLEKLKEQYKVEFSEDTITADVITPPIQSNCDIIQLAKNYMKSLKTENLARLSSASAFLKLLKQFRNCPNMEIKKILKSKKLQPILPQILDLIAFGGTSAAADAVFQTLQKKGQSDLMERFLLSLSLVSRPTEDLLQVVLNLLKNANLNDKLKASAISTIGALLKTMNSNSDYSNNEIFLSAVHALMKGAENCKSDVCIAMNLRGLRNAGLQITKPLLIEIAEKGGRPSLEALLALRNVGFGSDSSQCEAFCQKILHSTNQGSSTKAVAAEILLDCSVASLGPLKRLLITLGTEKQSEYAAFIASKLARKMEQSKKLRAQVFNLLSDREVANYFSLYHSGSSISFVKPLILAGELNSTYGVDMEMLSGGLLKRSSFDIDIHSNDDNLQLITVGMFAEGLGSFVGESSEGEEESPRAGLELGVLGVALRPYIFFESTSELMGHVWSGTASEPTPALQGNILITDHSETIILQNGLNARLNLQGVLSADLSGAVQISIWNRNSNSQVQNAAAFLMDSSIGINTLHDVVEDEVIYRAETTLDFLTQFDFYEAPYKMCLQMLQPEIKFLIDRRKTVSLANGKFSSKKTLKSKFSVPAKSFALHPRNDELCSVMLSENY